MNFGGFKDGRPGQPLPIVFERHLADLAAFETHCNNLMLKILKLFAVGLNVSFKPQNIALIIFILIQIYTRRLTDHSQVESSAGGSSWFSSRHTNGPSGTTLRFLHYPSIPSTSGYNPAVDIRAGAHSDYGSITLLFQRPGQPGLEIIPPSSQIPGERNTSSDALWTPVPVFPPGTESDASPPILVNIGDLLSYWTNNLFKSTVHRVVFPKGATGAADRYSIAYFGHPVDDTVLEPVPSELVRKLEAANGVGPELEKPITAREHLLSRLKATYKGLYRDEEGKPEGSKA